MIKQKLTDAIASSDRDTSKWKARFAAAKGAYEMGEFRQCESLLYRAMEQAKELNETTFALNTCRVGLGAVYIATGKVGEAREQLETAIQSLSNSNDGALNELCALAHRFYAELLTTCGDDAEAEAQLHISINMLKKLGEECTVPLAYSLSDLAALYVTQDKLKEAKELLFLAMGLLESGQGAESPEYIRNNIIYNICDSKKEEMLSQVEEGIMKMQYQLGSKHPSVTKALRWLLDKLQECGESNKIDEVEKRRHMHIEALSE